ncbi:dihydroneopterin aldolase [Anseongella ginsenosidimutans]|uniref:7,8-dihydroneopterin aldolase n=1 Tax=Anseongella ginsenosidimutans TaxID=496056 RepID=A0A4R3KSV7_9SPHI|nr:dihydroneopterin aldolase [Anseongella ginsenosidimutans]QEC53249.1 dihydroneopterin aldolase [Anseongella ginsenosidimutans]TCS87886.1 dihydroneopterin aldolase [Anseongella ginsenosidimutans]
MINPSEKHYIKLEGIEVSAPIGYYPEEHKTGTQFIVNIEIATDFSGAESEDDIKETVNYEDLVKVVKTEMAQPAKLIEHVAYRIRKELFRLLPPVHYLRLEIKKQHPSLELKTAYATVIMEYRK